VFNIEFILQVIEVPQITHLVSTLHAAVHHRVDLNICCTNEIPRGVQWKCCGHLPVSVERAFSSVDVSAFSGVLLPIHKVVITLVCMCTAVVCLLLQNLLIFRHVWNLLYIKTVLVPFCLTMVQNVEERNWNVLLPGDFLCRIFLALPFSS
jgi:hypothetical protein